MTVGVGAVALVTLPFNGVAAWTIGGLAASGAYVLMSGVEIAVAELLERDGET